MVSVAVVGCGSWGKNLIRVFDEISEVGFCCHKGNPENERWLAERYPSTPVSTNLRDVVERDSIDAVVVATPIDTHFEIARIALQAGKHVFVEKPITGKVSNAEKLVDMAEGAGLTLFVGYIFLYHPVFREIEVIHEEEPIKHIGFTWQKAGGFDEDIIENLGSHDIAIAYRLFGSPPKAISSLNEIEYFGQRNIVSLQAEFDSGRSCQMYLSRLSAMKQKTVTLVTDDDNLYFWTDDTLYKYDREKSTFDPGFTSDIEPLKEECKAFVECIKTNKDPETDGAFGLTVTRILDMI